MAQALRTAEVRKSLPGSTAVGGAGLLARVFEAPAKKLASLASYAARTPSWGAGTPELSLKAKGVGREA